MAADFKKILGYAFAIMVGYAIGTGGCMKGKINENDSYRHKHEHRYDWDNRHEHDGLCLERKLGNFDSVYHAGEGYDGRMYTR